MKRTEALLVAIVGLLTMMLAELRDLNDGSELSVNLQRVGGLILLIVAGMALIIRKPE